MPLRFCGLQRTKDCYLRYHHSLNAYFHSSFLEENDIDLIFVLKYYIMCFSKIFSDHGGLIAKPCPTMNLDGGNPSVYIFLLLDKTLIQWLVRHESI